MRILTRIFLAWLLICAIPLQGFAASAMLLDQSHWAGAVAQAVPAAPCHGLAMSMTPSLHDHEALEKNSKPGADTCSVCAACCTGAAVFAPDAMDFAAPLTVGLALVASAADLFASHISEGLDPPPRRFLA